MALNAAFFQDVTMFHPKRPPVRWSSVENLLARRNGGSKDVEAVMAKERFLVTAAMALIGYQLCECHTPAKVEGFSYDSGIGDWPLRRPPDAVVKTTLVGIIAPISVRQEKRIDTPAL